MVTSALRSIRPGDATWRAIQAWLADDTASGAFLHETPLGDPAGLLIDEQGRLCTATHASVVLRKRKDGSVYVNIAFVARP